MTMDEATDHNDESGDVDAGEFCSVVSTQVQTGRLFLSNPSTRTPVIVLYVATLGGGKIDCCIEESISRAETNAKNQLYTMPSRLIFISA